MLLLLSDDGPTPAFDLNFMGGMPAGLTYTNSSTTRTYFGSDGLLKTAVANEPIFEYNPVTLALLGMRWEMEQRTNLFTRSAEFDNAAWLNSGATVTANAAVAPDGTSTAEKLVEALLLPGFHRTYQAPTLAAALYTLSFFAKAAERSWCILGNSSDGFYAYFDLANGVVGNVTGSGVTSAIQRLPNGWNRISMTFTAASAAAKTLMISTTTGNGEINPIGSPGSGIYIWGAQVEAGASQSSYIPTAGSAVIRQPDVLTATSISPWYRQDEGTVVFEGSLAYLSVTNNGIFVFSDGTSSERFNAHFGSPQLTTNVIDGGVSQAAMSTANIATPMQVFKFSFAYKENDFSQCLNSGAIVVDTSGTLPTVNQLRFGTTSHAGVLPFMGYARRFQYYNRRLTNSQIQGLSRV